MQFEDTASIVQKCFHGEPASCSFACPFHLDVRSFLEKAGKAKWTAAYKALRNAVVFPAVVEKLCPAPCQQFCQRKLIGDEPISMLLVERAAAQYSKQKAPESYAIPPKGKRVAVVGAGAAGLACALSLTQKKFSVTVYDQGETWGGSLRDHPDFHEFDADFALQFSAHDVEFAFGREIKNLDELEEFDAIYVATGEGGDAFGLLPSYDPARFTTGRGNVFLGGGLIGAPLMESIAQGAAAARHIEVYLQTGSVSSIQAGGYDKANCERYVNHDGAERSERVRPSSADGYTEEEAAREAARCFGCDCSACMTSCEMLAYFRKTPQKIATEVFTDSRVNPPFSSHTITRETYSCDMCSYCKSVCPEGIDMGGAFMLSRLDRANTGSAPPALYEYWLREMDFNTREASFYSAGKGGGACEYVFFPGCQLGAYNPAHVLETYRYLRLKYDAGIFLGCCGAPAYWAGDEARRGENFEHIRSVAARLGDPVFLFACATCEKIFAEFLPEIKRMSIYQLMAGDPSIQPARTFREAAVFDPCNARYDADLERAVREIAEKSGTVLSELPQKNRCCSYGGLVRGGNPKMYEMMAANRVEMSDKPYLVYCANCSEVFRSHGKECAHILDAVFHLPVRDEVPKIAEKRRNSLRVKGELMMELDGMDFTPDAREWESLQLVMDPELAETIDRKLISEDDIKEAVWRAESTGDKFVSEDDGVIQCCLVRPVLTYWVQYKKTAAGAFEVLDAYYHRMRFETEGA